MPSDYKNKLKQGFKSQQTTNPSLVDVVDVPKIKGLSPKLMIDLYYAKC
jgi:hypothetical protein